MLTNKIIEFALSIHYPIDLIYDDEGDFTDLFSIYLTFYCIGLAFSQIICYITLSKDDFLQ